MIRPGYVRTVGKERPSGKIREAGEVRHQSGHQWQGLSETAKRARGLRGGLRRIQLLRDHRQDCSEEGGLKSKCPGAKKKGSHGRRVGAEGDCIIN